jgi:hypothetical protein
VEQMPLVEDQRPVQQFASAGAHPALQRTWTYRHKA